MNKIFNASYSMISNENFDKTIEHAKEIDIANENHYHPFIHLITILSY